MDTPFDRRAEHAESAVKIDEMYYRNDEIIVYFYDILNSLLSQGKSLKNKIQFLTMIRSLMEQNENQKAFAVATQAISRYPKDPELLKIKIEILIKLKDYKNAIISADEAISANPGDVTILMVKARIYSLIQDESGEEQVYRDITNVPGSDYVSNRGKLIAMRYLANMLFKQKRFEEAEDIIRKILKKSPDEASWSMYFSVLMRLEKKDLSFRAREGFARYTRASAFFNRGTEYELQDKFNLALANYRKGLEIFQDDPMTNMRVGSILMYRKKWYSKAEEYIKKAVELDPEEAGYRLALVVCLKNQGKLKEAFEEAKIAEIADPLSNTGILRELAIKLDRGEEFQDVMQKAIEKDKGGKIPTLRYELGIFFEETGKQEEAKKLFKEAQEQYVNRLKNYSQEWDKYLELGCCYKKLEMYEDAEKSFESTIQMDGADLEEVYENFVSLYQKWGRPEKATIYLQKLIKVNPAKFVNYIDLGANFLSRITSKMRNK